MFAGAGSGVKRACLGVAALVVLWLLPPRCTGQARIDDRPQLHTRTEASRKSDTVTVANRRGSTLLTDDVSGEYALGEAGNVIEISLQAGVLDGYISKLGDMESDRGTPLTYFFVSTELREERVRFATRRVHGVWYSFEGSIVRGPARSRKEPGFYLLQGELVEHDASRHADQGRTVSLKSARRDHD